MKVLLAGAGIGGLAAALSLRQAGFEVRIFERAAEIGEIGAGIQISPNGARVLHAMGLESALDAVAFRPKAVELRLHKSGFVVSRTPLGDEIAARYGAPYYHIHRGDLHGLLKRAVQSSCGDVIALGREVESVAQSADGVAVRFNDGGVERGDVLIGCDGIHSKVREALLGPEKPQFTGSVAWRGVVPAARLKGVDVRPVVTSWMAPHSHAVTYFLRRGELVNFVGVTERTDWASESWVERGDKRDLRADFDGWHPTVRAIVDAIAEPFRWAIYARDPLPKWCEGRVALLGDACHPMLPFLAQGAVMAIEDGAVLANCLVAGQGDVGAALKRYEQLRLPRTARVQAGARAQGALFNLSGPIARLSTFGEMSFASRFTPRKVAARRDWLMAYDATRQTA
ncbi:MAG TPA: FAD-dependent monooxygenase [Caulobacteraceae bacterium]|nr:FAD-dependent monooxygenase [Caulobacteraceae bacterium]